MIDANNSLQFVFMGAKGHIAGRLLPVAIMLLGIIIKTMEIFPNTMMIGPILHYN